MSEIKDLSGKYFGRLTVTGFSHKEFRRSGGSMFFWHCICECGRKTVASGTHLKTGNTSSCGCLHRERLASAPIIHGGRRSRLYRIWSAMKERCSREKHVSYKNYGARGIKVCDEWRHDFPAFRKWALSHGYADNLTIDRIDNDGNYCPENCQWLTRAENAMKRHGV